MLTDDELAGVLTMAPPIVRALGLMIERREPGIVRVRLPYAPTITSLDGAVAAGILVELANVAAVIAIFDARGAELGAAWPQLRSGRQRYYHASRCAVIAQAATASGRERARTFIATTALYEDVAPLRLCAVVESEFALVPSAPRAA